MLLIPNQRSLTSSDVMPFVQMTFKLSKEITRGLAEGRYQLFGAVVRDNSGHVVKMLKPVAMHSTRSARKLPKKVAFAAIAIGAVAAGGIYLGTRLTRKARLTRQLEKVDEALQPILTDRMGELTREDLGQIRAIIEEFLTFTVNNGCEDVTLVVPAEARQLLVALANEMRRFSSEIQTLAHDPEPIPSLSFGPASPELIPVLTSVIDQLAYQERHWPTQN